MEDHLALSDSKRRLCALLDKMKDVLAIASPDKCDAVFASVAKFAVVALKERTRRMNRGRDVPEEAMASPPALPVVKRPREPEEEAAEHFCDQCRKTYRNEQLCDGCNVGFRWCCAGYSREPCEDPRYPSTGAKIMLQAFCKACLAKKGLEAERVLQQEQEYLRILDVFSKPDCRWKWISCLCDGWSVFSVVWAALEGLLFLLSPFYCQIGTECDDMESRNNPKFHEFVVKCADEALSILSNLPQDDPRIRKLGFIRAHPELPSNFGDSEFDFAWTAVCASLNRATPTRICIWTCNNQVLQCVDRYGPSEYDLAQPRVIDVLKWNCEVSTHFDLLIPIQDPQQEYTDFGLDGSEELQ